MLELDKLPSKQILARLFQECCSKLNLDDNDKKQINDLVIYNLTDGTRTSTSLKGWEAYADGGLFVLRLIHSLACLGAKSVYVLTFAEGHNIRNNYDDIFKGMFKQASLYKEFGKRFDIKLRFIGNLGRVKTPGTDIKTFLKILNDIELATAKNKAFTAFILINYSTNWAINNKGFKKLPNANVIVKHTKGQINEGLWLPDKLHDNSFVYVQNGSASRNWSDKELVYLITIALRSFVIHKGLQYSKSYSEEEIENIRRKREEELSFIHKQLEDNPKKRVVIFSQFGPEIYEF